jgi:hypothetical protein
LPIKLYNIRLKSFDANNFTYFLEELRRENLSDYPHLGDIIQPLIDLGDAIVRQMNEFDEERKKLNDKISELNSQIIRNQEN